jgi:uncharacterized membrane protein
MDINGLPLHPLVVHAAVVFAPLAALLGLAYALVPRWRWALRWPLAVVTLVALASAVLAAASGKAFLESRPALLELPGVDKHRSAGYQLRNLMLLFTVAAGLAVWRLGGPSALASGKGARAQHGSADLVVAGLLVIAAVATLVGTFLAGHSGATAVWG